MSFDHAARGLHTLGLAEYRVDAWDLARFKLRSGAMTSELSYRRLFKSARDGILILDVDTGRISEANPFLVEVPGYSRAGMIGRSVGEPLVSGK